MCAPQDTLFVIARGGSTDCNVLFDVKEKSFDERLSILLRYGSYEFQWTRHMLAAAIDFVVRFLELARCVV